jgi:hypothetical protein
MKRLATHLKMLEWRALHSGLTLQQDVTQLLLEGGKVKVQGGRLTHHQAVVTLTQHQGQQLLLWVAAYQVALSDSSHANFR